MKSSSARRFQPFFGLLCLLAVVAGCTPDTTKVKIDGSSTVFPITEAVVEEYIHLHPDAKVIVGLSGTGGGFKKFCRDEIDITNASRSIKKKEKEDCGKKHINYIEIPVAYDGLAIVVHPSNTWAKYITVKELKKLWEPAAQDKIKRWNQIRPEWPDKEIHLYGAGVASGTYDYFTEAIVGAQHSSRGDYTASEDDNVLVEGISSDPLALGFFGIAYYEANQNKLLLVPVDDEKEANGIGPVFPTVENIMTNKYTPLSRPLFIYVNSKAAHRPEVQQFIRFYLTNVSKLVAEVGYVRLPDSLYQREMRKFNGFVEKPITAARPVYLKSAR